MTVLFDHSFRPPAFRDPNSTTYVGAIETAEEFGKRLYVEAWKRGSSRAEKKVVMGDGAEWIWNLAEQHFPGAIQIVDLYHARQHLWSLARRLHPNDETAQKSWIKTHQQRFLDKGKIEKLVQALNSIHSDQAELAGQLRVEEAYFERNAERMRYPHFRRHTCSWALALSKPAAKPSSARASNNPACFGPFAAPTPYSLCVAATSTAASRTIGEHRRAA